MEQLHHIQQLAENISQRIELIVQFYRQQERCNPPSFAQDAPEFVPHKIFAAVNDVLDATTELHDLFLGPSNLLRVYATHNIPVSLHSIARFDVANIVPLGESISFEQVAARIGPIAPNVVRRLLRHAMTYRIFEESSLGMVRHSSASKALRNPHMRDWVLVNCEEMWPAATKTLDAIQKWPKETGPDFTGYALAESLANPGANQTSLYSVLRSSPVRAVRFASAIAAHSAGDRDGVSEVVRPTLFNWQDELCSDSVSHSFSSRPDLQAGLLVDVGGGQGNLAKALAERYSKVRIIVQDLPPIIERAKKAADEGERKVQLAGPVQVDFQAHNFFEPQPVHGAAAYLFRWVLHNWSDEACTEILRNLIPALRPGARVLVNEVCLPDPVSDKEAAPGDLRTPLWRLRQLRHMDISMLELLNGQERDVSDWKSLFRAVSHRFVLKRVNRMENSDMALLDFEWAE